MTPTEPEEGHMDSMIAPLKIKAAGPADGLSEGQFEGYCSVFGNVDSYGDIVVKGAFADTLAQWRSKGDPIPLLWGHDLDDPFSNVGSIDSAVEDDHGLKVTGTFDLTNPKAAQVYKLTKGRRVTGMSFAYFVRDSAEGDNGTTLLKSLDIIEASIVPLGANPLAGVTAVKEYAAQAAQDVKAGRVLSTKNEQALRDARDAIDSVLSSLDAASGTTDQEKASEEQEPEPIEPDGAKSSDPMPDPSVELLAAHFRFLSLTQE